MEAYFKFLSDDVRDRKILKGEFPFSKYLFWDSSLESIDTEKHKNHIIERVISRGMLADYYYLFQMYNDEELISGIKRSKCFDKKTINFCCNYFKIPVKEMNAPSYYS